MQGHTLSRLECFEMLTLSLGFLPGLLGGHFTHCLSALQSKLHNGSLLPPCTNLHNSPLVHFTPICRSPHCTTKLRHLHAWPACSDFTLHTCPTGLMPQHNLPEPQERQHVISQSELLCECGICCASFTQHAAHPEHSCRCTQGCILGPCTILGFLFANSKTKVHEGQAANLTSIHRFQVFSPVCD